MANRAAWITAPRATPLKVDGAPQSKPGPGEVVVKNATVSINPVDWKVQDYGFRVTQYPNILGCDIAGEITEIGAGVHDLNVGQRVMAHAVGLEHDDPKYGGFQLYTVCDAKSVCQIPDALPFEEAVVLPLAISTASVGLFPKERLGLPYPTVSGGQATSKTVLIWGGSSSVGATAIQLAVAAGVEVVSVASGRNLPLLLSLGAKHAFDYNDPDVVDSIVAALKGTEFAGVYDAIATTDAVEKWVKVVEKVGGVRKYASVNPGGVEGLPLDFEGGGLSALAMQKNDELSQAIWKTFVPQGLLAGKFLAKPDPLVITGGLEKVQEGMNKLKAGVSAAKVVIKLSGA